VRHCGLSRPGHVCPIVNTVPLSHGQSLNRQDTIRSSRDCDRQSDQGDPGVGVMTGEPAAGELAGVVWDHAGHRRADQRYTLNCEEPGITGYSTPRK
jgi:hypothetical protein